MTKKFSKEHREAISKGLLRYHNSGRKTNNNKKSSVLERSRHSKSGHKTWRERLKEKRPGKWSNYWSYMNKHGYKRKGKSLRRR